MSFYPIVDILAHHAPEKSVSHQELLYALSSGGPAYHAAVVVPGHLKLLVIPTDDTWSPEFHKFN